MVGVHHSSNELETRLFEMYRNRITEEHCGTCREHNKELSSPISYWHLGNKPSIAFVGKTSWMQQPDDFAKILDLKRGPLFDVSDSIDEFFGPGHRRSRYWRSVMTIPMMVYRTEDIDEVKSRIFVTNLAKCDIFNGDYRNVTEYECFENCIGIFEKEMETVRSPCVIFFTNRCYDPLIDKLRFGCSSTEDVTNADYFEQIGQKKVCWWHRVFHENGELRMRFLRTRHPQGAPSEFETHIVDWIRNSLCC